MRCCQAVKSSPGTLEGVSLFSRGHDGVDLRIDRLMKIQDIAKKMGIPILSMWEDGVPEHHFYMHVARPPLPDRAYTAIDQDGRIVVISANKNLDEDLGVAEAVLHELMHIRAASFGDEGGSGLHSLAVFLHSKARRRSARALQNAIF